jgi:hypothetical protein
VRFRAPLKNSTCITKWWRNSIHFGTTACLLVNPSCAVLSRQLPGLRNFFFLRPSRARWQMVQTHRQSPAAPAKGRCTAKIATNMVTIGGAHPAHRSPNETGNNAPPAQSALRPRSQQLDRSPKPQSGYQSQATVDSISAGCV